MAKIRGQRVLAGAHAEVWANGSLIFECKKIEAKVMAEREDVQFDIDMDSKVIGLKGEGTLTISKVYTRFEDVRKAWNRGEDLRYTIMARIADPDAVGKQIERYNLANVWFNELPLANWEKGAKVEEEVPFGFTPSDVQNLDRIDVL